MEVRNVFESLLAIQFVIDFHFSVTHQGVESLVQTAEQMWPCPDSLLQQESGH